jgi:hypothetical protein
MNISLACLQLRCAEITTVVCVAIMFVVLSVECCGNVFLLLIPFVCVASKQQLEMGSVLFVVVSLHIPRTRLYLFSRYNIFSYNAFCCAEWL